MNTQTIEFAEISKGGGYPRIAPSADGCNVEVKMRFHSSGQLSGEGRLGSRGTKFGGSTGIRIEPAATTKQCLEQISQTVTLMSSALPSGVRAEYLFWSDAGFCDSYLPMIVRVSGYGEWHPVA